MSEKKIVAYQSISAWVIALTLITLFSSLSYGQEASNPNSKLLPPPTPQPF